MNNVLTKKNVTALPVMGCLGGVRHMFRILESNPWMIPWGSAGSGGTSATCLACSPAWSVSSSSKSMVRDVNVSAPDACCAANQSISSWDFPGLCVRGMFTPRLSVFFITMCRSRRHEKYWPVFFSNLSWSAEIESSIPCSAMMLCTVDVVIPGRWFGGTLQCPVWSSQCRLLAWLEIINDNRRVITTLERDDVPKPFAPQTTVPGIKVPLLLIRLHAGASTGALKSVKRGMQKLCQKKG